MTAPRLRIHEIFHSIQGESTFAGRCRVATTYRRSPRPCEERAAAASNTGRFASSVFEACQSVRMPGLAITSTRRSASSMGTISAALNSSGRKSRYFQR